MSIHPEFVFLVYPGTEKDKRAYFPNWMGRFLRSVFPIGFMKFGNSWGFIAATQTSAEDLDKDPKLIFDIMRNVRKEFPKVKAVALAGRLPGFVYKAGGIVEAPFVDGSIGTRCAMVGAAIETAKKLGKDPGEVVIGLPGGAGFVGKSLVSALSRIFRKVIALDPRYKDQGGRHSFGNVLYTPDPKDLGLADSIVVLTPKGDDIENAIPFINPGTIVADDTHPPIEEPLRRQLVSKGVDLWKVSVRDERFKMFPRLPNFNPKDIPGCLWEALMVYRFGREVIESLEIFNRIANSDGFGVFLERHPEDLACFKKGE